jgi:hypothetical protein
MLALFLDAADVGLAALFGGIAIVCVGAFASDFDVE